MNQPIPPPETSSPVTNPHDKTFKLMFKETRIAEDVMRVNLPDEIVADFDTSTIALVDGSFVTAELNETYSDVLYRVKSSTHEVYVSFLFEHKSSPDKLASIQVGKYIYSIWEEHLRANNELPIVVPIVFYHGLAPWNYAVDMRELIRRYEDLLPYYRERLPTMTHDLIDMRTQDESFIKQYDLLTQLIISSFKHIFMEIDLLLETFFTLLEKVSKTMRGEELTYYAKALLLYFEHGNPEFTEEKLTRKINELSERGEFVMNMFERERKEGLEVGLKEGIEKTRRENALKLLTLGVDIETVAEGTGLSLERVKEIKAELNGRSN